MLQAACFVVVGTGIRIRRSPEEKLFNPPQFLVFILFFRVFLSSCWVPCWHFGALDGSDCDQKKTEAVLEISKFGTWERISFQLVHIKTKKVNFNCSRPSIEAIELKLQNKFFFTSFKLPLIANFYWSIFNGQLPLDKFSAMSTLTLHIRFQSVKIDN